MYEKQQSTALRMHPPTTGEDSHKMRILRLSGRGRMERKHSKNRKTAKSPTDFELFGPVIAAAPGGAPVFESKIRGIADWLKRICVPAGSARVAPAQETRLALSTQQHGPAA